MLMRRIIVLNAKGGCGKTTLATNIASGYAIRGFKTALIDYDPQGSSMQWLCARGPGTPAIHGIHIHDASRMPLAGAWQLKVPRDTQRVVVDTPAGLRAMDLAGRITADDLLVVPIQPSAIDIRATADFIRDLLLIARLRPQDRRLAIVGNRTRRGPALQVLKGFLENLQIPVLEHLRDAPIYGTAAEQGLGVCELAPLQSRLVRPGWQAILNWLEGGVAPLPRVPTSEPVHVAEAAPAVPAFLTRPFEPALSDTPVRIEPKDLN
jgi:chromosome partitioning protein